jgi:hypothetical protein
MVKRVLGATTVVAATLIIGLAGATPASARANDTLTVTCTGGQVIVSDSNSLTGQTAATTVYNAVNPFGEVCTVHP